jgi:hypothetical protein
MANKVCQNPKKVCLYLRSIKNHFWIQFLLSLKRTCVRKEKISEIIEGHSNGDR